MAGPRKSKPASPAGSASAHLTRGPNGLAQPGEIAGAKATGWHGVPVSPTNLQDCLRSAKFWVDELPRYADRQQRWADFWALMSGFFAAVASLSVWPILGPDSTALEKAAVSTVALAAAMCALVPRVRNYAELAGQAREVTSRYGSLVGDLTDLAAMDPLDQAQARIVVTEFDATKQKKDSLRGLPDRRKAEIRLAKADRKLAEARQETAKAEKASAEEETAAKIAQAAAGSRP